MGFVGFYFIFDFMFLLILSLFSWKRGREHWTYRDAVQVSSYNSLRPPPSPRFERRS